MVQQKHPKKKNNLNSYARLSGIAFQMIAIVVIGSFLGVKLDEKFPNESGWYTLSLSLFSVILSVVFVIRNITSSSKDSANNE